MKALALIGLLVSNLALATCEVTLDPPSSGIDCEVQLALLPTGSEWTTVRQHPFGLGLNASGGITLDFNVQTNGSLALLGKLQAATARIDRDTVRSEIDDSAWIDVLLHRDLSGKNTLKLISYRYVGGIPIMVSSQTSSELGSGSTVQYKLSFSYTSGIATLNILNASNSVLGSISQVQFGEVIPVFRVRRGVQPIGTGVVSSSFTLTSYWSE